MYILALETSNQAMSVAVMNDHDLLGEITINRKQTHSQQLMPAIEQLMAASALTPEQLDRIVVADGPGSYTGIRIAVTTAKTLAYTLEKELVGISSLAVLAANVRRTDAIIVPLMNARRNQVFAGGYQWLDNKLVNVLNDRHIDVPTLLDELVALKQPVIFVGSDVAMFGDQIRTTMGEQATLADALTGIPSAARLAELGMNEKSVSVFDFVPRYLRLTEAETTWLKTHDERGHRPYVEKV
ncbi:tRNA (adenosine(37)-N6)-threonylcarbamoyltransferase complex dimerization subunit type 1 TsaB [Lacticaseibacillus saniviri]|uniref:Metal-dependent protease-like protein, putative molecular chaperone n=1 Tax=Lacticaseibacillus saniviri JCM 17471 = DSM 24301 TaxID=1293598 RepID=A0A0R2N2N4_9LACO|nr:tRNA (adenosine(37)-N6)-threonylcarbamoyltransferase complex dimerization subunit type 1 TsaB [Lacticaseibacillus saniviri]KRO18003.1 metal-dependent protease-like protein, putative molecular chaperone [Lacticaseibacillus saniviri JCM 17471 = DSM 24301]MCG4281741.1 tRNA (adenosine(37)-N6)-threonylcarbamoyltransferase complex dimerization subunit type 1 TsaB [Lacticaseibacillus saniviri]